MPEIVLDTQALFDGVSWGLVLGLSAGGLGWMIKLCFRMWRNLIG